MNRRIAILGITGSTALILVAVLIFRLDHPKQLDTGNFTSSQSSQRTDESAPITFEGGLVSNNFQTEYYSSDGKLIRFGCFEHESEQLHEYRGDRRVVQQGPKLNATGQKVGERLVIAAQPGSETEAKIVWTEDARLFLIRAPTVQHALLFEKSRLWVDAGCTDVAALIRENQMKRDRTNR
jgi:hypothetical protein